MHLSSPMLFSQTHRMIFFLKIHTFKALSTNPILILPEKETLSPLHKNNICSVHFCPTDDGPDGKKGFSPNLLGCFFLADLCSAWKLSLCDYINPFLWDCQCIQVTGEYRNPSSQWLLEYYVYFEGETQTPSVGPVGLASAMFLAMLTVATSNRLPAHQVVFPFFGFGI